MMMSHQGYIWFHNQAASVQECDIIGNNAQELQLCSTVYIVYNQ